MPHQPDPNGRQLQVCKGNGTGAEETLTRTDSTRDLQTEMALIHFGSENGETKISGVKETTGSSIHGQTMALRTAEDRGKSPRYKVSKIVSFHQSQTHFIAKLSGASITCFFWGGVCFYSLMVGRSGLFWAPRFCCTMQAVVRAQLPPH